jgi:tetrahydromethanopterin S-methyltransferase subunit G
MDRIEGRLDNIDGRLEQVEARLDKIDGRLEHVEARLDTHLTKDEFERARATLLTKDEFARTRAADREEMRRHFEIVTQHFQGQVGLVAEGHQMLADGQARILDRLDRLERDLGTTIKLAFGNLDRRVRTLEERRPS